jgi:hypothetical protein
LQLENEIISLSGNYYARISWFIRGWRLLV